MTENEALIFTTVCFFAAELGLLYHGYCGMRIPWIINLSIGAGFGVVLSYWFD
jgi:hypothetical protein